MAVTVTWIFLFHATVAGGIGIAILLNKKEDDIEEIKQPNQSKE